MILAAATTFIIERQFRTAALWFFAAAALSLMGLMHSYRWTASDTVMSLTPAWPWAVAYTVVGLFLLATPLADRRRDRRLAARGGSSGVAPRRLSRLADKARRPRIPPVCEGGATPAARMHRSSNAD